MGIALNALGQHEDALPLLLAQAENQQPDALSWFNVAHTLEELGRVDECVTAYERAIALEPDYVLAWFNLGGVYWNEQKLEKALRTWRTALERFPSHELSIRLRTEAPWADFLA